MWQGAPREARGTVQKKGGGRSLLGSRAWTPKYLVVSRGTLRIFESAADFETGAQPVKCRVTQLSLYGVRRGAERTKVHLVPLDPMSPALGGDVGRVFDFRAESEDVATTWISLFLEHGAVA